MPQPFWAVPNHPCPHLNRAQADNILLQTSEAHPADEQGGGRGCGFVGKLSDFGMAVQMRGAQQYVVAGSYGSITHMAPGAWCGWEALVSCGCVVWVGGAGCVVWRWSVAGAWCVWRVGVRAGPALLCARACVHVSVCIRVLLFVQSI